MKPKTLTDNSLWFIESPRWHKGKLWFADLLDGEGQIKTIDLEGNCETTKIGSLVEGTPKSLDFLPNGDLLFATGVSNSGKGKLGLFCWDGEKVSEYADFSGLNSKSLNDMLVSARGRVYIGSIDFDFRLQEQPRPGRLFMIGSAPLRGSLRDRQVKVVAEDIIFPNGIVITDDGKTLIIADSFRRCAIAFNIQEDGSLSDRRIFAQFREEDNIMPDGICLDAENAIWVATFNKSVVRVMPSGKIDRRIDLEDKAIAVMLGGNDKKTLFISTVGELSPGSKEQKPTASILTMPVETPGAGFPA